MLRVAAFSLTAAGALAVKIHEATEAVQIPEVPEVPEIPKVPEFFPVPTSSRCVVITVCQYMVVFLALAVCRSYHEFSGKPQGAVMAGLKAAAQTVTYGPMICVLFIACRMNVEFLSKGTEAPQMWVQNCMYGVTMSVLASTLVVLLMPLVTGRGVALKPGTSDLEAPSSDEDSKTTFYVMSALRYGIMLGLYGGVAGVIAGIFLYKPAGAILSELPAPAPAVLSTIIISCMFFATQLVIAGARSYGEYTGKENTKLIGVMSAAANTVEFGPMLCILFLAARMRALQHSTQPLPWAQNCMLASTAALGLTTIMAMVVPLLLGGEMKVNPATNEATFEVPNPTLGYVMIAIRCISQACFYGGAVAVAYSIVTFKAPVGPTVPVSPTVQCVLNLTLQYFFVYTILTVFTTMSEVSGGRFKLTESRFFGAVEASKATLQFAPMLAILFVTTRMYALLLTNQKGAPQKYVQDGMYMATWSLLISFLACLATGAVMDEVETDEDGNVMSKFSNKYAAMGMTGVRYLSMGLLYGGIGIVIYGLFNMTPENANGSGSIPMVSDTLRKTPFAGAPPTSKVMGF